MALDFQVKIYRGLETNLPAVLADGIIAVTNDTSDGKVWIGTGTGREKVGAGNHSGLDGITSDDHHNEDHQGRHNNGGADALKLDDLATPDDNTDLDSTTGRHGLLPKLGGGTTNYLRADGTWANPSGGGSTDPDAIHDNVAGEINAVTEKSIPTANDVILAEDGDASFAKKKYDWGNVQAYINGRALTNLSRNGTFLDWVDTSVDETASDEDETATAWGFQKSGTLNSLVDRVTASGSPSPYALRLQMYSGTSSGAYMGVYQKFDDEFSGKPLVSSGNSKGKFIVKTSGMSFGGSVDFNLRVMRTTLDSPNTGVNVASQNYTTDGVHILSFNIDYNYNYYVYMELEATGTPSATTTVEIEWAMVVMEHDEGKYETDFTDYVPSYWDVFERRTVFTYDGDGSTANRLIETGIDFDEVEVVDGNAGGTNNTHLQRAWVNHGVYGYEFNRQGGTDKMLGVLNSSGNATWQGKSGTDIKLGSTANSLANYSDTTYTVMARKINHEVFAR